ncbi:MAG: DUF2520 domain-containing protein [Clostridium sp.]|nr:DUF2520 domain-containing protein [Clostridium sp.]
MNLGRYFTQKGIELSGFYGHNAKSTKEASKITNSNYYETLDEIIVNSDIIFITTPDDIISIIDREISKFDLNNKSICHASGSLKSTILSNAKLSGALIYSIHPMFAFSNKNIELEKLENMYFSLEGDFDCRDIEDLSAIKLMKILGNKYFIRNKEDSSAYHLANVIVSNLVLSLLDIGTGYLRDMGLNEDEAVNALYPLIQGNIDSIHERGFINSLTGPVLRGDVNTIKKHLEAVKYEDRDLYKDLSINLLKLVGRRNISSCEKSEDYDNENKILDDENALKNLFINSEKHKEIYELLGGLE